MQLTPAQSRRQRQREEARRAILDATESLMVEGGGGDFSMRALAERCGYAAPTVYHYFGDKEGLIDALLEERFARLVASVRRVPLGPDPLENLRSMVSAFVRFGLRNPAFYRLILAGRRGGDRTPPSAEATRDLMSRPWAVLEDAGRLYADREGSSQSLWALLHGLTALRSARPDFDWAPDLIDTAVDSMLRGLVRPDTDAEPRPESRSERVRSDGRNPA